MTTNRISSDPSGRSPSSSSKSSTSQTSFSTPHQSLNSTIREASTNNHPRNDGKDDMPPPSSSCPRTSTSAGTVRRSIHRQRHRHRRRPSPCPLHRHGLDHRQVVATVALALMTALSSPGICGSSTVLCAADAKTIRGRRELAREGQEPIGGEESRHEQQKQIEHEEAAKQLREEGMRQKTRRKRPQRHQQQPQPQQPEPLQIPARTLQEEEHHCPPNHSGWAPSSTCQSYFWCSAGVLSSLPYSCVDGLLYDHSQQTCVEASTVDCSVGHAILAGELDTSSPVAPVSPTAPPATTLPPTTSPPTLPPTPDPTSKPTDRPTTAPTEPQPTPSPTDRPTSLGPPLYYVDYPSQTCLSSAASGVEHPSWLDELSLYRTKRECCTDHFGWTGDITSCLGPNWVETNVIWAPTASPTLRPSVDPTVGPTSSPTGSPTPSPTERPSGVPSDRPSEGPTVSPTGAPSGAPTLGPTTTGPTGSPTTSAPTLAPFTSMPTFAGDGFDGHGGGANSMTQNSASAGGTASISEAFDSQGLSQTSNQQQPPSHSTSGAEAAAAAIRDQYMVQLLGWANTDIDVSAIEGGFSGWQYQYHQQSQFQFDLAPRTDPPTPGPTASPTHPPTSPPTIPTVMEEQSQQYQISELILPVQGDATISEKRPSLNFGSHQALAVNSGMNGPGDERFDSLLKFDIALLDLVSLSTSRSSSAVGGGGGANRKIEEARLEIYVMESCDSGGTFAVASPSASSLWDASTVTWENAPSASGGYPLATLGAVAAGQWYRVDMTSALTWYGRVLVEEETSLNGGLGLGEEYLTVRMETDAEKRCLFSSMESGEALAPRLIVKFAEAVEVEDAEEVGSMEEQSDALDGSHQDQQQAEEEAAASTPESPVEYPPLPPPPPPVPGDFLLLRATDDATVIATSSTFNFGTQDKLVVAFDSFTRGIYDSLIKFDLREVQSVLPRSAVLSLFAEADCTSAGMFTTTTSSGEVGVGEEWTEDEVTWANAPMGPVDGTSGPGGADLGGSGSGGGMNIGTFGPIQGNNWYGFNVGDAVTEAIKNGKETVTFRLSSGNMNPCQYTSREGGRAPKLMVSF